MFRLPLTYIYIDTGIKLLYYIIINKNKIIRYLFLPKNEKFLRNRRKYVPT